MVDVNKSAAGNDGWNNLVTDVDGFWNEESKAIVQGRVVSIVIMNLGLGDTLVAIVSLTAPCAAVKGSGEEKEEIQLEAGQAIGVVIKHKLSELDSFVENQNEVKIEALKKIPIPGTRKTLWTYRIQFKGRRSLRPVTRPGRSNSSGDGEAEAAAALAAYD